MQIRVEEMQERVSHRLMNEAIMCLQDGRVCSGATAASHCESLAATSNWFRLKLGGGVGCCFRPHSAVIANAVDGDMGMVFGIGFPPFKGVIFTFTLWIDSWARSSVAVLI